MTFEQLFLSFSQRPLTTALCTESTRVSYTELLGSLDTMIVELGLGQSKERERDDPVDVIALEVGKAEADVLRLLACWRAGMAVVPVDRLSEQSELAELGVSLLLHDGGIQRISPAHREYRASAQRPVLGIFSSGSTGHRKLVWHSADALLANAVAANRLLPMNASSVSLLSLPLYHVGGIGLVLRALCAGACIAIGGRADDLSFIQKLGISQVSMVPTQAFRLLTQVQQPLNSNTETNLRILLGGAPIASSQVEALRRFGFSVHRSYGLSEMASQVVTEVSPDKWQTLASAELIQSPQAELWVRGSSLFLGYGHYLSPRCLLNASGWFATADRGLWRHPCFEFIGRMDNMFICGGENVYPESVEQKFVESGLVEAIAVVPLQDPEWGQRAHAFIQLAAGASFAEIETFAASLLPQQRPVNYYSWQSPQGLKVKRKCLIQALENGDVEKIH